MQKGQVAKKVEGETTKSGVQSFRFARSHFPWSEFQGKAEVLHSTVPP